MTEDIKSGLKAPKSKVGGKVTTDKYKDNFSEGYTKNWSGEIFVIYTVFKSSSWMYKIKYLNWDPTIGSLYENYCWVNLNELLFTTRYSFTDKVKVFDKLSNYERNTKKKIEHWHAIFDLAAEVGKLDINGLVKVPIGLNYLERKVNDLDVVKLKTVPLDLKKTSDVVTTEVSDAFTLIQTNQHR